jgi:hypothetical protein
MESRVYGDPEEDFPLFTTIRHVIFRPIGVAPAKPLPGGRATFYVPRSDGNPGRGRRLMYMRDLACCANAMASLALRVRDAFAEQTQ